MNDTLVGRALALGLPDDKLRAVMAIIADAQKMADDARAEGDARRRQNTDRQRRFRERHAGKNTAPAAAGLPAVIKKPIGAPWPTGWFNTFWSAYPRKVGKDGALQALERRRQKGESFDAIMDGVRKIVAGEKRFIPHPATWVNQGRWQDEDLSGDLEGQRNKEHERGNILVAQDKLIGALDQFGPPPIIVDSGAGRPDELCSEAGAAPVRLLPQGGRERPGDVHGGDYGSFG